MVATLPAGNYSAVVSGKNGGIGVGLAEVYDLDPATDSRLANISTRAFVGTNSDVLIGGFITGNRMGATRIAIRALGPSLARFGIAHPCPTPGCKCSINTGRFLPRTITGKATPTKPA